MTRLAQRELQRPIAAFDFGGGRHRLDDVSDLLKRRHPLLPTGLGYPGLFSRQVEIFSIGVRNSGFPSQIEGALMRGGLGNIFGSAP